jgi:hypothetical protein
VLSFGSTIFPVALIVFCAKETCENRTRQSMPRIHLTDDVLSLIMTAISVELKN